MATAATRAIIARMLPLRPLAPAMIFAALLVAACGNDAKPQATADTAAVAAANSHGTAATATDATAAPEAHAEASAEPPASANPSAPLADPARAQAGNLARPGATAADSAPPQGSTEPQLAAASASAAAEAEPVGKTFGDKAVESMYAAWLQSAGRYTVGKPASVQAVVVAKGEYKCNDNYPYKFKLNSAPAGLSFPDTISRAVTKGKARSVVSVPFTPTSAGNKTISGTFYFSVCNDSTCKIAKQSLSVTVMVHDS